MPKIDITVPALGESVSEAVIGSWLKADGETVAIDEPICELESDKAALELPAEQAGVLTILSQAGEQVQVGAVIGQIDTEAAGGAEPAEQPAEQTSAQTSPQASAPAAEQAAASPSAPSYAAGHPSPAAEKQLKEAGIAPEQVTGTGPAGRITKADAQRAQSEKTEAASTTAMAASPSAPAQTTPKPAAKPPRATVQAGERRERMSSLRKTIARRLVSVQQEMAVLTTFNEVDMQPIMSLRTQYKQAFQDKHGVKLGFMSFFVKASCQALQEFPVINASVDGDEIVYHAQCDISIAVSTPKGLVVPVIRGAETLSFAEIESTILELGKRAQAGKLTLDEMQGGTFSITNGGIFGSMLSTPIINPPQSAILGMHNIVERPVAVAGEVKIRPIMYLALSYDHRLIDGRDSVQFLYRIKELLEDPARLLLAV